MTVATYTLTENAATSIAREVKIGVRAKSGSSIPSKASDWKGGAFPVMTFSLAVGATSAQATIETVGNSAVDGNREFEFYEVSRSPNSGQLSMQLTSGTITDDDTAPVATFIQPYNREFVALGDSRSQFWGNDASNHPYEWQAGTTGVGQHQYLPAFTDGKLLCGARFNFGISGNSIESVRARDDTSGKSLAQLAANRAAIVFLLLGTNNAREVNRANGSLPDGGQGRIDMAYMINYLTNPAAGAPLFGGQPKTIVLMNEWPCGKNDSGGEQNSVPAGARATWKSYSDWLLKFSYDSGDALANPRVVAIDTFNASTILDAATGTSYFNRQGLLLDGLHANDVMAIEVGKVVAPRLNSLLPTSGNPLRPSTANAALLLNPNPFMTGTGGTKGYYFTDRGGTLVGSLPDGTTISSSSGGGQGWRLDGLTVTTSFEGTGDDRALVVRVNGTATTPWEVSLAQSFTNAAIVDANDQFYGAVEVACTNDGAVKVGGGLNIKGTNSADAKNNAGSTAGWNSSLTDGSYKKLSTPLIDRGDGTGKLSTMDGGLLTWYIQGQAGAVDSTVKLRRFGAIALKVD